MLYLDYIKFYMKSMIFIRENDDCLNVKKCNWVYCEIVKVECFYVKDSDGWEEKCYDKINCRNGY